MSIQNETQEDALHIRVFRNRPEPGHRRIHTHPTHELNFLCHGYQGLEVENRNYTMIPGDLLVLPAGLPHSIRSDESLPYQRIRLHLPVHFDELFSPGNPDLEQVKEKLFSGKEWVIRFPMMNAAYVTELMERMVAEAEEKPEGWELGLAASAQLLALMASRNLACAIKPVNPHTLRHRHDMNLVIHFMEEHYAEPITLGGMAQIFDVHPSVLSRNFKRATGSAPMLYLNKIRVAHAKTLMEETSDRLEDIAKSVGYRSLIYFSRVFRELNGEAPSQYRRRITGETRGKRQS